MKPRIISIGLLLVIAAMLIIVISTGCTTAGKATQYFDGHRDTAAGYCATRYPVKTDSTSTVTTDSSGYKKTVNKLLGYSDSLLSVVSNKNDAIDQVNALLSFAKSKNEYSEQLIDSLQAKMARVTKTDTGVLRKSVSDQVRTAVAPCHDTTITKVVENTARVAAEKARADKYQATADEYTNGRNEPATVFGWLFRALFRKWWFWVVVVGLIGFLTRKLWIPKIPFLSVLIIASQLISTKTPINFINNKNQPLCQTQPIRNGIPLPSISYLQQRTCSSLLPGFSILPTSGIMHGRQEPAGT